MRPTAAFFFLLILAAPSVAQDMTDSDRYSLEKADDGFVRLDRKTGQMSICKPESGTWACRSIADDRKALEDEIARLGGEIDGLRKQLQTARRSNESLKLPSRDDVDQMMDLLDGVMGRFKGLVEEMERDAPSLKPKEKVPGEEDSTDKT